MNVDQAALMETDNLRHAGVASNYLKEQCV